MNFIDEFLNQPKQGAKTAAVNPGAEQFLDLAATRTYHRSASSLRAASVADGDDSLAEAVENVQKKASGSEPIIRERSLSDEEVKGYVKKLLNEGVTPKEVEQKLTKLAEINVFDRSISSSFLNDQSGVLGLAYIEPNHYMSSCPDSYQRQSVKFGGVRAKSVKQIKDCRTCVHFAKQAGKKRCNLYRLPIVASKADLLPIINNLVPEAKTATQKKAALVALANKEGIKAPTSKSAADVHSPLTRVAAPTPVRSVGEGMSREAVSEFRASDVARMHQAGEPLNKIYAHAVKTAGTRKADEAVRGFIKGLKRSNLKVALTQIDCTQLKGKLSSANAIVGERKCASCTYRTGMHCGLTGGTLLSFPGMDKAATNHHIAEGAPKDGLGLVASFELDRAVGLPDIDIKEPNFADVEVLTPTKINL